MGLTGIIYGAIVCLWLCYLVPLALRRHDEAARARSVDRFSSAMRVLGGSGASRAESRRTTSAPAPPVPAQKRRAARVAAARRRRVLALLVLVVLAVTGAAMAALVPVWAPAAPVALVVAFLLTARAHVRRAATTSWERELREAAVRDAVREAPAGDRGANVVEEDAPTVVFEAPADPAVRAEPAPQQVVTTAVATTDGSPLWDPLPVTLPTYVSKPRAERSIRTIDLGSPGAWTSGHLPDGDHPAQTGASAPSEAELAAAPRAVGD